MQPKKDAQNKNGGGTPAADAGRSPLNPFAEETLECPICEAEVPYRYVKNRLYQERDPDIDLRPRTLMWQESGLEWLRPRHYYMRHCPKCRFTAGGQIFEAPTRDSTLPLTRLRRILGDRYRKDERVKRVVERLSSDVTQVPFDHFRAIKLHLLAIYWLLQVEDFVRRDAMDLGRYCLRLAWLYRDLAEAGKEEQKRFVPQMKGLLEACQGDWPKLPGNERMALLLAASFYRTALEGSYAVRTDRDEVAILLLIARIQMRLGELTEAHKFLTLGLDKARRFERQVQSAMKPKAQDQEKFTPEQLKEMQAHGREMKRLAEDARRTFEDVQEAWERRQTTRAKQLLEAMGDRPDEEKRAALIGQKIDQRIVDKLLPPQTQKGFLGLFRS